MAFTQGELLVRAGLVTAEQHRRALDARARDGGSLGECLIRLGLIDEERLATFYHKRLVLPLLPETSLRQIAPAVLALVPAEVAAEFRLLPVAVDRDGALLVAMADPSDTHAVDELGFFVDRFVLRTVATESAVRRGIERHYGLRLASTLEVAATQQIAAPAALPELEIDPFPEITVEAPRPAFIPTTVSPPLPAKREAPRPLFPANEETYDPLGRSTAVGKRTPERTGERAAAPAEEVVVLTRKKRGEETPLPPHAPPPVEREAAPRAAPEEEPLLLTKPRRRERHATLPGLHPPDAATPPLAALRAAAGRDEVAALLLDYAAAVLGRAVLFVVRGGTLAGYDARGGGLDRASVEVLQVPLAQESLFREVTQSRLPYRGALPATPHNRVLARALGTAADADVLVLPILVRDRVVALLFGDSVAQTLPEAALQALCYEAGLAYERILRQARANAGDLQR